MSAKALIWLSAGFAAGFLASNVLELGGPRPDPDGPLTGAIALDAPGGSVNVTGRQDPGQGAMQPRDEISDDVAEVRWLPSLRGPEALEIRRGMPSPEAPAELGQPLEPEMVQGIVDQSYEAAAEMEQAMLEAGAPREQIDALRKMADYTAEQMAASVDDGSVNTGLLADGVAAEDLAYEAEVDLSEAGVPEVMIDHVVKSLLDPPEEPLPPPDDPRQLELGGAMQ